MKTNLQIEQVLNEFSEILQLKGEISFKITAYQKAAEAVRSSSRQIEDIYKEGGLKALQQIDGIGEGISEKIEEFIKTEKVIELEKLRKEFPREIIEYLRIPGVGPATAKIIYKKFGKLSIDKLATKLSIDGLQIFKPKSLKKILSGIEIYKNIGDRMTLSEALEIATPLENFLKQKCFAKQALSVGSLRRRKDTIGDIDLVASSEEPKKTINCFEKYPLFQKIIGKGETKLTAIMDNGKEVDLEILPSEKFGSLLLHFTGSKVHNIALRELARKKGLGLSEHGFKNEKTGEVTLCAQEKDIYDTLGLQFIEPELREDRGEIEQARKGQLPHLVNTSQIKGDLHLHSTWSDGKAKVIELAKKAKEKNYSYIAVCDHIEHMKNKKNLEKQIDVRAREIEKAGQATGLMVLNGCEVSIASDGTLDLPDNLLKRFEFVIASIHWDFNQPRELITKRIIKAIENPYVRLIGHPSTRKINRRLAADIDWPQVFLACEKNDVALEISSSPLRLDLMDYLIIEAKKYNIKFFVNTDAHELDNMDFIDFGVYTARRGWCEKRDIINTSQAEEFKKWLDQKNSS